MHFFNKKRVGVSVSEMQLGIVQYLMARKLCLCKNIKSEMFEKIFCKIYSGIEGYDLAKKLAYKTFLLFIDIIFWQGR